MSLNLSIRTRLLAISVVAVAVLLLIAALAYVGLKRSNAGLESAITATTAVLNQKQADMMHDALRADVLFAIVTGPNGSAKDRQSVTSDLADHVASFEAAIAQLQALPLPPPIRDQVAQVVPLLDAYVASAQEIVRLALTSTTAGRARLPDFMVAFSELEASMEALGEQIESRGAAVGLAAQRANTVVKYVLILGAAMAAGALVLVNRGIARSISGPLTEVKRGLMRLAEGNLATRIGGADRQDEIGEIATALEVLRDRLQQAKGQETEMVQGAQQRVVRALSIGLRNLSNGNLTQPIEEPFAPDYETLRLDYNHTLDTLTQTIAQVVDASESIRARSAEISHASEDLSARTENQAATLEETAAALDELTASVKAAAEGAREVEKVVHQARTEATESGAVVQGAVDAMNEIERSSEQISQIIGVIDDIAFQTNLLALNAGVEAARAGDAGRGFAVVASEVRALAQRSSAAAKEIKLLISASTQHVDRGVDQVGRAGSALTRIVERVTEISSLVSEIASGAREQSVGLAEVNIGVTQLDQVTQHNAAMVEQSTAACQSLKQEAAGMATLVAQFSLRKGRGRDDSGRQASAPAQPRHAA
ncbi:MAG: methyl-accepting chemotaxis protein [Rhodobacter sp.]|nr:methyl-accepting chemotaxis protein [Rhodobacter sp.]